MSLQGKILKVHIVPRIWRLWKGTHILVSTPWNEHFSTCALRCEGVKKALEDSKVTVESEAIQIMWEYRQNIMKPS